MTASTRFASAAGGCLVVALAISGWQLSAAISSAPTLGATITQSGATHVVTHTRLIHKVVKGRVVTLKSGRRVVYVPRVVIHNLRCHPTKRHHCVRWIVVPAHRVPIRAAPISAVAVAAPLMPVTVYVTLPPTTVTQPVTITETGPIQTITVPTTITVTCIPPVCLPPGGTP
jgi:hypothetical protein